MLKIVSEINTTTTTTTTFVGPTATRLEQDPLAVVLLNNRHYMSPDSHMKH